MTELSDNKLDQVTGGSGGGLTVATCTQCHEGRISIPMSGPYAEYCPKCGALIICADGKAQYSIPKKEELSADWDTDDAWL